MVIQGYDEFFKMYNKQNNKKVKDIVENIVEVLLLLVATFFLFKGIFMMDKISNDTSLKQIVASEVTFFVSLVASPIEYNYSFVGNDGVYSEKTEIYYLGLLLKCYYTLDNKIKNIILKMCEYNCEKRYKTFEEIKDDLIKL